MLTDEPTRMTTRLSEEEPIWEGRSSQWVNVIPFALCLLVIPIPYGIYRWLSVRCTTMEITTQRVRLARGILTKVYDDLEIYRVKDITLTQPLLQRLVGLGTVTLLTSDSTHPELDLRAIHDPLAVRDVLREQVEIMRRERGVRELDVADHGL